MNATANSPAPPNRRRRWPKVLLAVLGLFIAFPFVGYWILKWSAANELASAVAELSRTDPNWRLDDIEAQRETLKPEENSALQVIKVYGLARPADKAVSKPEFYEQFEKMEPAHELNALQITLLREAYAEIQEALVEARKLKDLPKGRFPIKYSADFISTLIPGQQNARQVMQLLMHDAWLRAQGGDLEGALESCRAGLNTARSLGDEPILISVLIRIAGDHIAINSLERTLAQGKQPPEKELKAIQDLLAQEMIDAEKHWINSLRGERGGQERIIRAIDEGKIKAGHLGYFGGGQKTDVAAWLFDFAPGLVTREYPALLQHMNQAVEAAKLPTEQQRERLHELQQTIPKSSTLVRLLMPALEKVGMAHVRNQAMLRAAQIAVAAERYRLKQDRWPESIGELVKAGLLTKVPTDPYDGAEMRMRRWEQGLVVYGVGLDKTDNGGILDITKQLEPGFDMGVKLWDPQRRRQAPRPPVVKDDNMPQGP